MRYNYVDIGTCDFEIADGKIKDDCNYLFVEPIFKYLERLPSGKNITKVNYAITDKKKDSFISYIEEDDIIKYSLPMWMKGCNKLGQDHPRTLQLINSNKLPKSIIKHLPVKCITFKDLMELYNVEYIEKLKIDTEGHDHVILKSIIIELINKSININQITFEYKQNFNNTSDLDHLYKFLKGNYPNGIKSGDNYTIYKS